MEFAGFATEELGPVELLNISIGGSKDPKRAVWRLAQQLTEKSLKKLKGRVGSGLGEKAKLMARWNVDETLEPLP